MTSDHMPPGSELEEEPLTITEILDREKSSILRPLECKASDGKRYFIKTRRTDTMPLICEWVCSNLAQVLHLSCPPVCIAWLPQPLVAECGYSDYDLVSGWAFGSQVVDLADTFPKAASPQVKEYERQRLLAFDHWIHNCDRRDANPNLLWLASEKKMWIIDHHLTLSPTPIREARTDHIFREEWRSCWEDDKGNDTKQWLKSGLDHLPAIFARIPEEWRKHAGDFEEKIRILLSRELP